MTVSISQSMLVVVIRQSYWDDKESVIGQTAVVMADAVTQNQDGSYSLRFPRFKTFRDDK